MLKIGQVAALANVSIDTIRYYERIGLLPPTARRSSGYRSFDAKVVERIKLIKHLQELSLPLEEIAEMLIAVSEDGADCLQERERIEQALRRTQEKLAALRALRRKLRQALERCDRGECDLVERARGSATRPG